MKASIVIIFTLVAVASCRLPTEDPLAPCNAEGPEVYCASESRAAECEATEYCQNYLRRSPCDRGPKVFCKTAKLASECGKTDYCLTWPNDHVVAERITRKPPTQYPDPGDAWVHPWYRV